MLGFRVKKHVAEVISYSREYLEQGLKLLASRIKIKDFYLSCFLRESFRTREYETELLDLEIIFAWSNRSFLSISSSIIIVTRFAI